MIWVREKGRRTYHALLPRKRKYLCGFRCLNSAIVGVPVIAFTPGSLNACLKCLEAERRIAAKGEK